jgi:hypothetical protein
MAIQTNMIAAGWNNYSLTNIESITVSSNTFVVPTDIGFWQEGQPYLQGNSIQNFTGYAACHWEMAAITMAQYDYIFNTLLSNKYSGKVTIRTRQFETGNYVICNAILTLPQRDGLTARRVGKGWYGPFVWEFTRVEIIEEELMHGVIYATGASTAQAGVTTSPELLTAFAANGVSDNMAVDHTADSITALFAGDYEIICNLNFVSTASTAWRFHIRVDAVEQVYSAQATSNATPDEMSVSFGGILALSANEIITVYVESDAGGGASITVSDCQLMAKRLALNV